MLITTCTHCLARFRVTPQQLNANVSEELSKLVMECVRMMPKDRPADMAQVLARLTM